MGQLISKLRGSGDTPNADYRDFLDRESDKSKETKIKTALVVAGALVVLGMALAIYLTSAGKMGHISDPYGKYVPGHYEGWWHERYVAGYYEPTSLAGINYALYGLGMAAGLALVLKGIHYNRERSQRNYPKSITNESLVNALKTDSLEQMHERLYQKRGDRAVNLGDCVREGRLTPEQVTTIDNHLRGFQAQFAKKQALLAEQNQISQRNGNKSIEALRGDSRCPDHVRIQEIDRDLGTIQTEMSRLNGLWKGEDLFNRVAHAAGGEDENL